MSKVLVQKIVTVTLEMSESEANGLADLLCEGVGAGALSVLKLTQVRDQLKELKTGATFEIQAESVIPNKKPF